MARDQKRKKGRTPQGLPSSRSPVGVRIIGGRFRGRKLEYSGDLRTRPMKDRVREALFNLLGPAVNGKVAVDLFAGTGALGLESLSRGAAHAIFVERHRPTAEALRRNVAILGAEATVQVIVADTFLWTRNLLPLGEQPWLIFSSPPYEFYANRRDDMIGLLDHLMQKSPPRSLFAVESDDRFDLGDLPQPAEWDIRPYPPAILAIWEKREFPERF